MAKPSFGSFAKPIELYYGSYTIVNYEDLKYRGNESSTTDGFILTLINPLISVEYFDYSLQKWLIAPDGFTLVLSADVSAYVRLGTFGSYIVTSAIRFSFLENVSAEFNNYLKFKAIDKGAVSTLWSESVFVDKNISNTHVSLQVKIFSSNHVSSSNIEFEELLNVMNVDINETNCFKCGSHLTIDGEELVCINSHTYTKKDFIFKQLSFLNDIASEISQNKLCGVQFQF